MDGWVGWVGVGTVGVGVKRCSEVEWRGAGRNGLGEAVGIGVKVRGGSGRLDGGGSWGSAEERVRESWHACMG
jgi:hypothetical protein